MSSSLRNFFLSATSRLEQTETSSTVATEPPPPPHSATPAPDEYTGVRLQHIIGEDAAQEGKLDKARYREKKESLKVRLPGPKAAHDRQAGRVVSVGKMDKTVTVEFIRQHWNRYLRKYFRVPYKILAHDENGSIIEGDVVTLRPERYSKRVYHHVDTIRAPFEKNVDQRPAIYTREEYQADRAADKAEKAARAKERLAQGVVAGKEGSQRLVDDGGGKGPDGRGRPVMPGGQHKFGKINEEAVEGKRRTQTREQKIMENDEELGEVKQKSTKKAQRRRLGSQTQTKDRRLI